MVGLHRVRNELENDPASAGTEPMRKLIGTTREDGQKVEAGLAAILEQLDAVAAILKPGNIAKED